MTALLRRLGLPGAAGVAVAAMLGAGVFSVWAPAAARAGWLLPLALALAATVAALNALSTIRLAVAHPTAGGAYRYGRAEIGQGAGAAAGLLFLVGKTASAGAIARVAAEYLLPDAAPATVAAVAAGLVAGFAAINGLGIRSTAGVSLGIAAVTVVLLVAIVVVANTDPPEYLLPVGTGSVDAVGSGDVLGAASLLFFAFAGYARIATLSEEVRNPRRTLPIAAVVAVAVTFALYAAVAATLLARVPLEILAASDAPLLGLVGPGWSLAVRLGAVLAALGSLLGVLAGLSRTAMAMGRDGELPTGLAAVSARTGAPIRAELVVAALSMAAAALVPFPVLVGLSSCAVLGYYSVAHLASFRRGGGVGWRAAAVVGLVGCAALSLSAPLPAVLATAVMLAGLLGIRALLRARRARRTR